MRGRKPKPSHVRIAEGNPGKRPLPEPVNFGTAIPGPGHALWDPPDDFPPLGARFWTTVIRRLVEVGAVDVVDGPALEDLAWAYVDVRRLRAVIEDRGYFAASSRGQVMNAPWMRQYRDSVVLYNRLAENFGLNPMSRTRLGLAELQRQSMAAEVTEVFGEVDYQPIDGVAIDVSDASDLAA